VSDATEIMMTESGGTTFRVGKGEEEKTTEKGKTVKAMVQQEEHGKTAKR